jgi:RNA polymerase sigma-70 factor (ECF subfamily)
MCLNSLAPQNENQLANLKVCEAQLPRDAKGGKAETFEKVCQALRPRLLKTAIRITRNREDAEDAVQDSLIRAYLHIEEFQGNSAFSTWLTRIVMNSALMINRKNRNASQVSTEDLNGPGDPGLHFQIPDHSPNPEQTFVQRERTRILRGAIRKLRPRVRAVVEVAQFHDFPIKETAKVLDISVAPAKGRFCHARAQLRKSLALRAIARPLTEPRHEFAPCVQDWFRIPGQNERSGFFDRSDPNRSPATRTSSYLPPHFRLDLMCPWCTTRHENCRDNPKSLIFSTWSGSFHSSLSCRAAAPRNHDTIKQSPETNKMLSCPVKTQKISIRRVVRFV